VENPKDRADDFSHATGQEPAPNHHIEAPSGLDLHPEPPKAVRISRRTSMALLGIGIALLLAFAYGGYKRTKKAQAAARESSLPKAVAPATQASREFTNAIPAGTVPLARDNPNDLQPPPNNRAASRVGSCGTDAKTGRPYRYDPETGRACDGTSQQRMAVRQPATNQPLAVPPAINTQPSPEEQALAAAYQREQEAEVAPTAIRSSETSNTTGSWTSASGSVPRSEDADLSRIAALTQALKSNSTANSGAEQLNRALPSSADDFGDGNKQPEKEAFLAAARNHQKDDYLNSTRIAPLSKYEIKAGWEIPAILEQSLNSDLPGELKALVTSNVYDTATGMYLLIPQGSRLIGRYDSRLTYAQDGVQVVWNRLIFPDGSSVDLDGMVGLDAHGNAGLRDKVDHHYKRLIGFSALTSIFSAAFAISQRTNQSVLAYPTPGQAAGQAVGQELSQTGSQITRRNLNVQPTVKVPAGYKFTVRVNRDILFDAPYEPMQPTSNTTQSARSMEE
jgi:type IV secretory pathway VirB10-like protein